MMDLLSFSLHDEVYAVDLMAVREIREWVAPTPLPLTPDHVLGVINLRGVIIPVIDIGRRLALERSIPLERSVIVVMIQDETTFGIVVDTVADIVRVAKGAMAAPPPVEGDRTRYLSALICEEDGLIRVLDPQTFLPDEGREAA